LALHSEGNTYDLLATFTRILVGTITITPNDNLTPEDTRDDGILVKVELVDGCEFTGKEDIAVEMFTGKSTSHPRPGGMTCKGAPPEVGCPFQDFSIDDCCAEEYNLFIHVVVDCGGNIMEVNNAETAYARISDDVKPRMKRQEKVAGSGATTFKAFPSRTVVMAGASINRMCFRYATAW
jgi:hypothetical protein